jgi:acetoacetyl-CoA synthetase
LVSRVAKALAAAGIEPGDRVAAYMPNVPETVIAMLAATSLGAVWSSTSPDFGRDGVVSRFGQTRPRVLFAADGYSYSGKLHDRLGRLKDIMGELPSVEKLVVVPFVAERPDLAGLPKAILWEDFMAPDDGSPIPYRDVPAEHPLYVMYSSGTTGLPKCLVQSTAGILLHHVKELMLHTDLNERDTLFYFTTCGWMMWNWLVSGLSQGAALLLYDGSPFHPHDTGLWQMADEEGVTIFGVGARYLEELSRREARPGDAYGLSSIRTVLSTGSPLCKEGFRWVYGSVKSDVQLSSICGGTDLNGCLAIGNPLLPVYAGELQCRPLGMLTEAVNERCEPVRDDRAELVCLRPFPSMPLHLWGDDDGAKYRAAYFERFPGVWHHGDYVMIRGDTGGLIVFGRSDTTLNPGGVRIGTAEIYPAVESIPEVEDSLVIGQDVGHDVRIVLFVKMREGFSLTEELRQKIKLEIGNQATRRHVPARIVQVPDIPYTISGKKVELAVRNVIHGLPVTNRDALKNPSCLDFFAHLPELSS